MLADLEANHPCLWGKVSEHEEAAWVLEPDAYLLPTRSTGADGSRWWEARKQGGVNRDGQPISALSDQRGERHIYPLKREETAAVRLPSERTARATVLYGGTLFDNFGHLLLDLSRTYQLLRLFRNSKEPIWFHYPSQPYYNNPSGTTLPIAKKVTAGNALITNPTIREWLDCLGILDRARLIKKTIKCSMLASSSVLYRDRAFVSRDFPSCAQAALAPKLRQRLLGISSSRRKIAYFSRHKLSQGTTQFAGEQEVVEALKSLANVDIICPEDYSIKAKLGLFRDYPLIAGFPQAGLILKYFAPYQKPSELARLFLFAAGPRSLNSNWVNLERAFGFGDQLLDCSSSSSIPDQLPGQLPAQPSTTAVESTFQRSNLFNVGMVIDTMRELANR
jgi:hypothetical protein